MNDYYPEGQEFIFISLLDDETPNLVMDVLLSHPNQLTIAYSTPSDLVRELQSGGDIYLKLANGQLYQIKQQGNVDLSCDDSATDMPD